MGHDLRSLAHTTRFVKPMQSPGFRTHLAGQPRLLAESCEEPAGDLTGDKEGDESQW